mgnify:CR=1 FL=1
MFTDKLKRAVASAMCLTLLALCCSCNDKGDSADKSTTSKARSSANASAAFSSEATVTDGGSASGSSSEGTSRQADSRGTTGNVMASMTDTGRGETVDPDTVSKAPPAETPSNVAPIIADLTPIKATDFYGRVYLSKLGRSKALLAAYDRIVEGVENCSKEINLNDKANLITVEELDMVIRYYRNDYPHHFWLDATGGFNYTVSDGKVYSLMFNYSVTGKQLEKDKKKFNTEVSNLLANISGSWSEYDREKAIHDRIIAKTEYVLGAANAHNAFGAIVDGKCVCEGYAKAFQYLCYQAGIQCLMAVGTGNNPSTGSQESHAWNVVLIGGKYYHVDATWDDSDSYTYYGYFNMSDAAMSGDHTVMTSDGYPLPKCDSLDMSYFGRNGGFIVYPYSFADVGAVFKAGKSGRGQARIYVENANSFKTWFSHNYKQVAVAAGLSGFSEVKYSSCGHEVYIIYQ